jgi:hypothetical protein
MKEKEVRVTEVEFHGDVVATVEQDGIFYVPVKRLCENLGIDFPKQFVKIKADARFSYCDIATTAQDGKSYKMFCLPLDQLSGWLFTINPNKVRSTIRLKLITYQKECVQALHDYWHEGCAIKEGELDHLQSKIAQLKKDKANLQSSLSRARKQISEGKQKLLPPPAPEPGSETRTVHINLLKRLHQCCLSKNPLSAEASRRIVRALLDGKEPPSHDETMKLFKLPFYEWQLENSKTWNLLAALNVPGIDQARAEVQTWALFARYCLMFWEHTYDGFKNLGDQVMTLDRAKFSG